MRKSKFSEQQINAILRELARSPELAPS